MIGDKLPEDGEIKPTDIKDVLRLAVAAGLSRETERKIRGVMDRVFKHAIADGKIEDNPVAKLPRRKRAERPTCAT